MQRRPAPTTPDQKVTPAQAVPVNRQPTFRPGQRSQSARRDHSATGGPAQTGATVPNNARGYQLNQVTPSWREFDNDFFGAAAPSQMPDTSGGGAFHSHGDLKANSFRQLGDLHGGRQ